MAKILLAFIIFYKMNTDIMTLYSNFVFTQFLNHKIGSKLQSSFKRWKIFAIFNWLSIVFSKLNLDFFFMPSLRIKVLPCLSSKMTSMGLEKKIFLLVVPLRLQLVFLDLRWVVIFFWLLFVSSIFSKFFKIRVL